MAPRWWATINSTYSTPTCERLAACVESIVDCKYAEGVGFEPTMTVTSHSGFQDRRTRPLCEPSRMRNRRSTCGNAVW